MQNYPAAPIIFDAKDAFEKKILQRKDDSLILKLEHELIIDPQHIYSKVFATMYGLNDALARAEKGVTLREDFDIEMEKLSEMFESKGDTREYGTYAYYPRKGNLVQFAPKEMNRLALVASNSSLYLDPGKKLSYEATQRIFRMVVPAVMGLSVGSNIVKAIMQVIRPDNLVIADPAMFKATNQNRVTGLSYDLMLQSEGEQDDVSVYGLRNKAYVLAEQLHSEDPFPNIFCYSEGVTESNLDHFLEGDEVQPRANVIVEVCDSTNFKLFLAEKARKLGIRFIRITDAGDSVWMDIRPFDLDKSVSIAPGHTDLELHKLEKDSTRGREDFFNFVDALVGEDYRKGDGEFAALVNGNLPRHVSSIPQSGATTMVGGGLTANTIARMVLGHEYYERMVFDMRDFSTKTYFTKVAGMKLK
jgi:tRNA A37 threonylcarbamoyladenosine dehydratase